MSQALDATPCPHCHKPKSLLLCEACQSPVCKGCAHFLSHEDFDLYITLPPELTHQLTCPDCFQSIVEPALNDYETQKESAKNIAMFMIDQGKETRFIRRQEKAIKTEWQNDREKVVMMLAFAATQKGFNSLLDVDIQSKKEGKGSYQKTLWKGSGIPAKMETRQLMKDRSLWSNPN